MGGDWKRGSGHGDKLNFIAIGVLPVGINLPNNVLNRLRRNLAKIALCTYLM